MWCYNVTISSNIPIVKKSTTESSISAVEAREIIARVNEEDLERARKAVGEGVDKAYAEWIPAPLIAEALSSELVRVARTGGMESALAGYLRNLADRLDRVSVSSRHVN